MGFELDPGYIDVAERIRAFRDKHPDGSLDALDRSKPYEVVELGGKTFVVVASAAYRSPDDPHPGVGLAWEPFPGRTPYTRDSEMQNAQTSSWGRAIVAALAADTKHIASAEEVRNRAAAEPSSDAESPPTPPPTPPVPASAHGLSRIRTILDTLDEAMTAEVKAAWVERRIRALSHPDFALIDEEAALALLAPFAERVHWQGRIIDLLSETYGEDAQAIDTALRQLDHAPVIGTEDEHRILSTYIEENQT